MPEPQPEPQADSEPVPEANAESEATQPDEQSDSRVDPEAEAPPRLPEPLVPGDIVLSVLADRKIDTDRNAGLQQSALEKPSTETAQGFLTELKSFWQEEEKESALLEVADPRFSERFLSDLDQMLHDLDESAKVEERQMKLSAEAAAGVSISLTAGIVSWALRAGSMVASFLAAMPTWRNFDPMPVLSADEKKKGQKDLIAGESDEERQQREADEKVDRLFER